MDGIPLVPKLTDSLPDGVPADLELFGQGFAREIGSPVALQGFQDAGQVSSWASDAVSWAVSSGLISGTGNQTLAPTATATRAEVAQIMMAFRKGQA